MDHKPTLKNLIEMRRKYSNNNQQSRNNNKANNRLQDIDTKTKVRIEIIRCKCI